MGIYVQRSFEKAVACANNAPSVFLSILDGIYNQQKTTVRGSTFPKQKKGKKEEGLSITPSPLFSVLPVGSF